jgi:hypothetical protein
MNVESIGRMGVRIAMNDGSFFFCILWLSHFSQQSQKSSPSIIATAAVTDTS